MQARLLAPRCRKYKQMNNRASLCSRYIQDVRNSEDRTAYLKRRQLVRTTELAFVHGTSKMSAIASTGRRQLVRAHMVADILAVPSTSLVGQPLVVVPQTARTVEVCAGQTARTALAPQVQTDQQGATFPPVLLMS